MASLYVNNSNDIYVDQVANASTGAPISDGTFTLTIKDSAGVNVTGAASLNMPNISTGVYMVSVPYTVTLTNGALYRVIVAGSGTTAAINFDTGITVPARNRTG